jgi:hypothetical protein
MKFSIVLIAAFISAAVALPHGVKNEARNLPSIAKLAVRETSEVAQSDEGDAYWVTDTNEDGGEYFQIKSKMDKRGLIELKLIRPLHRWLTILEPIPKKEKRGLYEYPGTYIDKKKRGLYEYPGTYIDKKKRGLYQYPGTYIDKKAWSYGHLDHEASTLSILE